MNIPWKPVFNYKYSDKFNSQKVYDEILKIALTHRFRNSKELAVPVNNVVLTEAIFDLNSKDKIIIAMSDEKNITLNGQQIKELFITTIFLKFLESKFKKEDYFFMAIPETEFGCDTAVMVVESGNKLISFDGKKLKLPSEHFSFEFQIKEYVDFKRLKERDLLIPDNVNPEKIVKIIGEYSEYVLVFMRDFLNYNSKELDKFFKKHPNCFLISMPQDITKKGKTIPLKPNKHNYIIAFPNKTFATLSFDRPTFLMEQKDIRKIIGKMGSGTFF